MTKRSRIKPDPLEREIELALSPGVFIRDWDCFSFVESLEGVVRRIDRLLTTTPARATALYEVFLAGCHAKAEQLDASSGSFGMFAKDLICRWIKAWQASAADADETAATLLEWMVEDPHAFCYEIEAQVTAALDKKGRAAFEFVILQRLDAVTATESYERRRWSNVLRATYLAQKNAVAYQALAERMGPTPQDCLALATLHAKRKPDLALTWVARGIELDQKSAYGLAGYELRKLQRALLSGLGRTDEAVAAAWTSTGRSLLN